MTKEIIGNIIAVGAGSCVGGIARYLVSLATAGLGKGFPWGTLAVNLAGCFLIGLLGGYFGKTSAENTPWALFLTVGFCGGFTTFSTFSKEALLMLHSGSFWSFACYVAISIIAGTGLVSAGYLLVR